MFNVKQREGLDEFAQCLNLAEIVTGNFSRTAAVW